MTTRAHVEFRGARARPLATRAAGHNAWERVKDQTPRGHMSLIFEDPCRTTGCTVRSTTSVSRLPRDPGKPALLPSAFHRRPGEALSGRRHYAGPYSTTPVLYCSNSTSRVLDSSLTASLSPPALSFGLILRIPVSRGIIWPRKGGSCWGSWLALKKATAGMALGRSHGGGNPEAMVRT